MSSSLFLHCNIYMWCPLGISSFHGTCDFLAFMLTLILLCFAWVGLFDCDLKCMLVGEAHTDFSWIKEQDLGLKSQDHGGVKHGHGKGVELDRWHGYVHRSEIGNSKRKYGVKIINVEVIVKSQWWRKLPLFCALCRDCTRGIVLMFKETRRVKEAWFSLHTNLVFTHVEWHIITQYLVKHHHIPTPQWRVPHYH